MKHLPFALILATASGILTFSAVPRDAAAQLIDLRTVPLAAGDQFRIFPSRNFGMGSVSIALDDILSDPFVSPAKGAGLSESQFFSAPVTYSVSEGNGGARTLPVGVLLSSERWFGGALAAMQQVEMGRGLRNRVLPLDPDADVELPAVDALSGKSSTNKYFQVTIGRRFGGGRYALAASAIVADLNALDGVEQLFANAWEIDEYGHSQGYSVGFTADLEGDAELEAVLVHSRFDMTHDVTSVDWTLTDSAEFLWTPEVGQEANLHRTRTWGAHLGYVQPIGETDWRIGGILTANRKLHPKIPTYDLRRIEVELVPPVPRDPGDSWAYNFGAGIAYLGVSTTFGLDLIYEPAYSHTWAYAETDVVAEDGSVIPAGGKTVDNRFVFSNARANVGVSHEIDRWAFQLGARMHSYDYRLRQTHHVQAVRRSQTEEWTEWTPTWGLRVSYPNVELRYVGSASSASHFPWPNTGPEVVYAGAIIDEDILAAPGGPLTIPDETVVMHRLSISVPIR